MEYRIETWTLSGLHETNKLGSSLGSKDVIDGLWWIIWDMGDW
jgi:hypothetical protein